MNKYIGFKEKIGELLQTNKLAIFLEIIAVVIPLYVGLLISYRLGSNHIPLWGDVVILGGPFAYLGMVISLMIVWIVSRMRGVSWGEFGLARPKSWIRTILVGIGVSLALLIAAIFLVNPLMKFLNLGLQDLSRFDVLYNNLPALIINLVFMWITAGWVEELLWRGYLMNRLTNLFGKTKLAWAFILISSAAIFGFAHIYQGPAGIIRVGIFGLLFGLAFLLLRFRLWPLVIAHIIIDTVSFVQHFLVK
jgi:membrane protease YdiL (CAAX protease family)